MTQRVENPESEQQKKTDEDENKTNENELSKFQRQNLDHAENNFNKDANQRVDEGLLEQEQIHTEVHEERKESPLIDKTRVDNAQSSQEGFEENIVLQGVKRKVVQLVALKHQGKTLSMLGEIGVG